MSRHLHLNLFIHGRGHHEAAWRHPSASPLKLTDIGYYTDLARRAEAGLFDSVFLADTLGVGEDVTHAPRTWLEPVTTLAALAGVTCHIGLIATCSTTYTEPFNLARQFASIDHVSGGRVGWNIVTTWLATASGNYGGAGPLSHAERYERAEEYMKVVTGLWDSWSDDAVLDDRANGQYLRRGQHPGHEPCRPALPGGRPAEHSAWPAGAAGVRAGGLIRHRPAVRRTVCRGGVHRADGEGHREGFLCRPESARRRRGPLASAGADPARPQPGDRRPPKPRRSVSRAN